MIWYLLGFKSVGKDSSFKSFRIWMRSCYQLSNNLGALQTCMTCVTLQKEVHTTVDYRKAIATKLWILLVMHFPKELYTMKYMSSTIFLKKMITCAVHLPLGKTDFLVLAFSTEFLFFYLLKLFRSYKDRLCMRNISLIVILFL